MPNPEARVDPASEEEFLAQLYRGGELLAAGNVAEAKDHLERAYTLHPRNEKAQNLLGLTYFKLGIYDRAAHLYEKLVLDNPADPTLRVNLGLVYLKSNDLARCIREFETATDLSPEHKKAHNYLGLALAQVGEYVRAREHFVMAGSEAMADKMAKAAAAGAAPPKAVQVSAAPESVPPAPPRPGEGQIEVMSDEERPPAEEQSSASQAAPPEQDEIVPPSNHNRTHTMFVLPPEMQARIREDTQAEQSDETHAASAVEAPPAAAQAPLAPASGEESAPPALAEAPTAGRADEMDFSGVAPGSEGAAHRAHPPPLPPPSAPESLRTAPLSPSIVPDALRPPPPPPPSAPDALWPVRTPSASALEATPPPPSAPPLSGDDTVHLVPDEAVQVVEETPLEALPEVSAQLVPVAPPPADELRFAEDEGPPAMPAPEQVQVVDEMPVVEATAEVPVEVYSQAELPTAREWGQGEGEAEPVAETGPAGALPGWLVGAGGLGGNDSRAADSGATPGAAAPSMDAAMLDAVAAAPLAGAELDQQGGYAGAYAGDQPLEVPMSEAASIATDAATSGEAPVTADVAMAGELPVIAGAETSAEAPISADVAMLAEAPGTDAAEMSAEAELTGQPPEPSYVGWGTPMVDAATPVETPAVSADGSWGSSVSADAPLVEAVQVTELQQGAEQVSEGLAAPEPEEAELAARAWGQPDEAWAQPADEPGGGLEARPGDELPTARVAAVAPPAHVDFAPEGMGPDGSPPPSGEEQPSLPPPGLDAPPVDPSYQAVDAPRLAEIGPSLDWSRASHAGPFLVNRDGLALQVQGELLSRLTGLVAVVGEIDARPEMRRIRGRSSDQAFGEGAAQMQRVTGQGMLYLEPGRARFHAINLDDDAFYVKEELVFAFEEAVAFENGRLTAEGGLVANLLHLKGEGQVLLRLEGELKTMAIPARVPLVVPLARLVGWYGMVTPRLKGFVGQGAVELNGEGYALLVAPG